MWKCNFKSGANLRLLVNSKKATIGSTSFASEQLLDSWTDDKGLRRVMGYITDEAGNKNGKIKVAYTMDVVKSNPAAATRGPPNGRPWDETGGYHDPRGISRVGSAMSVLSGRSESPVHGGVIHAGAWADSRAGSAVGFGAGGGVPHAASFGGGLPARSGSPTTLRQQGLHPHSATAPNLLTAHRQQMLQQQQQQQQVTVARRQSASSAQSLPNSAGGISAISETGVSVYDQPSHTNGRQQSPAHLPQSGGRGIAELSYPGAGAGAGVGGVRAASPPPLAGGMMMMFDPSSGFDHGMIASDLIDRDPRRHLQFPFNVTVIEMSTVDLQSVHTLSKNSPYIRIYCDDYYNETIVRRASLVRCCILHRSHLLCDDWMISLLMSPLLPLLLIILLHWIIIFACLLFSIICRWKARNSSASDVDYFRDLHWTFRVNERSMFKVLVCSRDKDVGSALVDLESMRTTPMDNYGLREVQFSHHAPARPYLLLN